MRSLSVLIWSSFVAVSACGDRNPADLKITNGAIIQESEHPEVVNLYRRVYENGKRRGGATCTGTWIGRNTIITAAHCIGDGPSDADGRVQDADIMVFEVTDHSTTPKATRLVTKVLDVWRQKEWEVKKGYNRYDLAILRTAEPAEGERPRGLARISQSAPQRGEAIEIIGYGFYDMSTFGKKGDDLKRVGRNKIAAVQDGFINIVGAVKNENANPSGDNASAGNGDSGGPMFRRGELIGVASAGGSTGIFSRGEASYVDLSTPESRAFVAKFAPGTTE